MSSEILAELLAAAVTGFALGVLVAVHFKTTSPRVVWTIGPIERKKNVESHPQG